MKLFFYCYSAMCFFATKEKQTELLANSLAESLENNLKTGHIISELGFPTLTEPPKKKGDDFSK